MAGGRSYSSTTSRTTTTADPGTSGTTLTVADSTVFASLDGKFPYALVINTDGTDREIVYVTARPSSTTLTVTRGRDGTTGQAHAIGATVDHMMIAADLNELSAHVATDRINVKDAPYGAKGDGTTDDRAAIQAAIDAAAALPGGVVYFPPGVYVIGDALVLKTGVTLQGSHGSGWPFRFPNSSCVIMCSSTFAGECAISMLGADITSATGNEGATRIFDLDISGERLPAGSVSGIHAQGEVMDVVLARMTIKEFTHNGIHTNIGTGTKPPHDWFMDSVVCYSNTGFGFSMSMTDGYIRDCIASTNGGDGWLLGPFGSLAMVGCQALFNTGAGATIGGGAQVGNLSIVGYVTDRNGHDGLHLGTSTGAGSPSITLSGIALNRDGKNANAGGGGYAGLRIDGCANPIIINGVTCNTGVEDDGSGANSPQYGASLTGGNAYVSMVGGYLHGDTAGLNSDGTTVVFRRFNVDEATGSKTAPTFVYGNGVVTDNTSLSVSGHALGTPTPEEHDLIAWSFDPANAASGQTGTSGTVYLAAVYVARPATATKLFWGINTVGAGPTSSRNFVGLYDSAGTRLASVGVDARVTTTGLFTETINVDVTPGKYWVAFLFNVTTTMPAVYRAGFLNATLANVNSSGANARFATNGTGTALPSSITPASNVVSQNAYWAALG